MRRVQQIQKMKPIGYRYNSQQVSAFQQNKFEPIWENEAAFFSEPRNKCVQVVKLHPDRIILRHVSSPYSLVVVPALPWLAGSSHLAAACIYVAVGPIFRVEKAETLAVYQWDMLASAHPNCRSCSALQPCMHSTPLWPPALAVGLHAICLPSSIRFQMILN